MFWENAKTVIMKCAWSCRRLALRQADSDKDSRRGNPYHVQSCIFAGQRNNLIYKAIKLLKDEYHFPGAFPWIWISLFRLRQAWRAAVRCSIDDVWCEQAVWTNLSMGKMMELGVRLGADVPYCVMRGTALAEGIGEKLTRTHLYRICGF